MAKRQNTITGERLELARAARVANQQMRRLEKAGYTMSPAYKSAQAYLTALGVKPTKSGARRFPEHYNRVSEEDLLAYEKGVRALREPDTRSGLNLGTVAGFRKYISDIFSTADTHYKLTERGVTPQAYYKMWSEMSDKEKDRVYGSEVYIRILKAYSTKYGNIDAQTNRELWEAVNSAGSFFGALKAAGISLSEYMEVSDE